MVLMPLEWATQREGLEQGTLTSLLLGTEQACSQRLHLVVLPTHPCGGFSTTDRQGLSEKSAAGSELDGQCSFKCAVGFGGLMKILVLG